MDFFRQHRYHHKALVVMVFLSLLLQVQTAFACQMMDHSGPEEHCCCGDMKAANRLEDLREDDSPCCEFTTTLTAKDAALEEGEAVAIQSLSSLDLPHATLVFILVSLWPNDPDLTIQEPFWERSFDPGHPGTDTYLSTLRLRI